MGKIRRIHRPVGVHCPECESKLELQGTVGEYFYECECGVLSYRFATQGDAEKTFPKFYTLRKHVKTRFKVAS